MILLDNTVLSNFALVGELVLLKEFCGDKGATTAYVFTEFERGVKEGLFIITELDWLKRLDFEDEKEKLLFANLSKRLGAGEASCLAVAIHKGHDLLSDDMAVRKIALRERIRLSGSIGVLIELIRMDRISLETGNEILRSFIKHGYFSPTDRLDDLL
ncbi:MAG: DUF3368 domain-containing protein [Nitrospira sp.]|nr:DUF3368 domain-containing protein [Nitrospira sp.]